MEIINLKDNSNFLETLARWHHDEWQYLSPNTTLKRQIAKMQLHLNSDNIPSTFVAKRCDNLLGSAAIVEHDLETRLNLSPWLAYVFVAPEYRNNGIGTRLVLKIMDFSKNIGVKNLYLFTPDQKKFYQTIGWSLVDTEIFQNHRISIMRVKLNG